MTVCAIGGVYTTRMSAQKTGEDRPWASAGLICTLCINAYCSGGSSSTGPYGVSLRCAVMIAGKIIYTHYSKRPRALKNVCFSGTRICLVANTDADLIPIEHVAYIH